MISLPLKAAGCKTGMCMGLSAAHPLKSSLFPHCTLHPPHHRSLSHTYTHIHRAAHSGCRWQLVCARQETLCTQLVNRESGSLTCRRRVSSSPGEWASLERAGRQLAHKLWGPYVHYTLTSYHPLAALGEDNVRLTINNTIECNRPWCSWVEMLDKNRGRQLASSLAVFGHKIWVKSDVTVADPSFR